MFAGRYARVRELGAGAMAATWLARDRLHDEDVTLKVLREPSLLGAMRREFARLRSLRHAGLVRVRDFGAARDGGERVAYYTARHVPGTELGAFVAGGPSIDAVRGAVADVARALAYLHAAGVRHGDVKPANVIVRPDGRAVLIDLGCAAALGVPPVDGVSGTPGFLAPELLEGRAADGRADLYGLGQTLAQIAPAFGGEWPDDLRALAERCAQLEPSDRPVDAAEVLERLGESAPLVGAARSAEAPLLGREEIVSEARDLIARLDWAASGPRTLWLHGPEGIGRTRLLDELRWEAQLSTDVVTLDPRDPDAVAHALAPLGASLQRPASLAEAPATLLVIDDAHRLAERAARDLETLMRLIDGSGPIGLIATSLDEPPAPAEALLLAPLSRADVARWCAGRLSDARLDDVVRLTGGSPGAVAALLAHVGAGDCSEEDLAALKDLSVPSERRRAALEALPEGAIDALIDLCLADGRLAPGVHEVDAVAPLLEGRWAELDERGLALPRPTDASRWLAALDPARVDARRRARAAALADEAPAIAARLYAEAGDTAAAEALLPPTAATGWGRAAEALVAAGPTEAGRLRAAQIAAELGRPERALRYLEPLEATDRFGAHLLRGECRFRLGDLDGARAALERARELASDGAERAMALDVLARCAQRAGAHGKALEHAEAGFDALGSEARHPGLRARLLEDRGVALSYLGEHEESERALERASRLAREANPRDRVRIASYRGINAHRTGRAALAATCHREALSVAEEHGLSDYVATCALNLGTAQHQLGEWGPALASYERGLEVARALGKASTRRTLEFDLAKLLSDIGLFDRAVDRARAVEAEARAQDQPFWVGSAASVQGEALLAAGRPEEARDALARAAASFEAQGASRELVEVRLTELELALEEAAPDARARLDALAPRVEALESADLGARLAMVRAATLGDTPEALAQLERAHDLARSSSQRILQAEVDRRLAWFWSRRGAPGVASRHAEAARDAWERTEGLLPESLREPFRRHPRRAVPDLRPSAGPAAPGPDSRFRHLLDINRKLNSSLDPKRVLDATIDAAIELTGAERGFVILAEDDGALEIAVARNLDREKVPRSHLKVSHSIAERVLEAGEPVLTVDAREDPRFRDQASVHAMKLRSVICVPVRSPHGVLGALYLDNRFRAERFGKPDLELLLAFSDQAALAIRNARLVAALEEEKARVEQLARGQALQIDELEERVRAQSAALAHRYDYSAIIGQSDPMRRVFDLLDRLTASEVTVLVQGESGTGKELVARAIHFNGPRREAPFVTINCGALPDTLLESELFGHVRGAFTGAVEDKDGLFVSARGGTLFLDEVGEMSEAMQVKLLRVLQERRVRPLGRSHEVPVDVRVLAATNRDLAVEARAGRFREDLYYRLAVVDVRMPPLRERMDDLPLLVAHLRDTIADEIGAESKPVSPGAMRRLASHDWPGNVRELRNVLARAFVLAEGTIEPSDIDLERRGPARPRTRKERDVEERARLERALEEHGWRVVDVARSLGIPRSTLYRRLKRHGLRRDRPKPD